MPANTRMKNNINVLVLTTFLLFVLYLFVKFFTYKNTSGLISVFSDLVFCLVFIFVRNFLQFIKSTRTVYMKVVLPLVLIVLLAINLNNFLNLYKGLSACAYYCFVCLSATSYSIFILLTAVVLQFALELIVSKFILKQKNIFRNVMNEMKKFYLKIGAFYFVVFLLIVIFYILNRILH